MDESIRSFLASVTVSECRVQNTLRHIFLCGGKTQSKGRYLSARDYFFRYLQATDPELAKRVRLAERINDWYDHALFGDLLEVEELLADCSDLTILFVESPGSIAELGAFAASTQLGPKTLAILNTIHDLERTFIADGPVRRLKSMDEDLVRYWKWDPRRPNSQESRVVFEELSKDIIELIERRSAASPKQELLNRASVGHTMFAIADYIDVVGISIRSEIIECLACWGFETAKSVDKCLSLLERFNLVRKEPLSTQAYYLSRAKAPYIKYAFAAGTKTLDRDRLKSTIRRSMEENDPRRAGILRRDIADRARRSRGGR